MSTQDSFRDFELDGWSQQEICAGYDKHFGAVTIQSGSALLDSAHVVEGKKVLNICCGAGYLAGFTAKRGASAVGIDFSQIQIGMASKRYPGVEWCLLNHGALLREYCAASCRAAL